MEILNKSKMVSLLGLVKLNYPNFVSPGKEQELAQLWWNAFNQHPMDSFERAVMKHIETSPYPPKISDINKILKGSMDPLYVEMLESLSPPITDEDYNAILRKHGIEVANA